MYIKYKKSYLTDGTKVKITHELFNQLKKWEMQGIEIDNNFKEELKIQDNNWINSYRGYYTQYSAILRVNLLFLDRHFVYNEVTFNHITT